MLVAVVTPEDRIAPASAEAVDTIFGHRVGPPGVKASSCGSVGELDAQEFEWVVQVAELGNLQSTPTQVVNRVLL